MVKCLKCFCSICFAFCFRQSEEEHAALQEALSAEEAQMEEVKLFIKISGISIMFLI